MTLWKCLRCGAGQEWINYRRTQCLRCGAEKAWLEQSDPNRPDAEPVESEEGT